MLLIGAYGDGTPFMDTNVHDIADMLENRDLRVMVMRFYITVLMETNGNQTLYGSLLSAIEHMVEDKVHSRSTGPRFFLRANQQKEEHEMVVCVLVKWNEIV